jgi:uncharacterized surface protein with fasciclin (FAS1) repeats
MLARSSVQSRPITASRRSLVCRAGNIIETAKAKGFTSFVAAVESGKYKFDIKRILFWCCATRALMIRLPSKKNLILSKSVAAGLTATLSDPAASFTVFVPTNAAFAVSDYSVQDKP